METTEKIVEAYVRYVRRWATIPNIRCPGQKEIDLLAINPATGERYHIESGVSVSQSYSSLTAKPFSLEQLHQRVAKAGQRRTVGYFVEQKFSHPDVVTTLAEYGFCGNNYQRVIVTWGCADVARAKASELGIDVWDFRDVIQDISTALQGTRAYFTDDTLRTIHLFCKAVPGRQ